MKKSTAINTASVIVAALLTALVLSTGCQTQDQTQPNPRKLRLLADENQRLKQQLADLTKQTQKTEQLLEEARAKECPDVTETQMQETMNYFMQLVSDFEKKNKTLTEENEKLKSRLAQLKK